MSVFICDMCKIYNFRNGEYIRDYQGRGLGGDKDICYKFCVVQLCVDYVKFRMM